MINKDIRQQFADTMLEVGQEDPDLMVLVSDISHFKLQPFAKACPGRFYNIGICEPSIVSMSAGLSKVGFVPVTHTITPFLLERSFEQIKLDFCYQKLGGNLISVGSAFDYANLGCTHHCYTDFSLIRSLPETQIFYPGNAVEFDELFRQNYRNGRLNYFRIPARSHDVPFKENEIKSGKALTIQSGRDLTIVVTGPQLKNVLKVKDLLIKEGWDPEIIYVHTVWPLDSDVIISSIKKTRRVLTIEEHAFHGGLGQSILYAIKDIPAVSTSFLCIPAEFMTRYGTYDDQCARIGLTPEGIIQRVKEDFMKQ